MCKRLPRIIFDIIPNCVIRAFNKIIDRCCIFQISKFNCPFCNLYLLTKYVIQLAEPHTGKAYLKSDIIKVLKR